MRFDEGLPSDATYEFLIEGDPAGDDFQFVLDLEVVEHNNTGTRIVGFVLNSNDEAATLVGVRYLCLDENLTLIGQGYGSIAQDEIAAGQQAAFSVELRMTCTNYILTANGL